jgi:hypothetical protein
MFSKRLSKNKVNRQQRQKPKIRLAKKTLEKGEKKRRHHKTKKRLWKRTGKKRFIRKQKQKPI